MKGNALGPRVEKNAQAAQQGGEFACAVVQKLTDKEVKQLDGAEQIIARGLNTFLEVSCALMTIRDGRLYRERYQSFEAYCSKRWRISRAYAYRLIDSVEVVQNVSPIGNIENESQARELARYEKDVQRAVMQMAIRTAPVADDGKPILTAGHFRSVGKVLTEVIEAGAMDDGSGEMKSLGVLVDANVTEETYERLMRQKEYIKQAAERKASRSSHETTQPRLTGYALELVTELVRGIEEWNFNGGIPDCLKTPYLRAKAAIGENIMDLNSEIEIAVAKRGSKQIKSPES